MFDRSRIEKHWKAGGMGRMAFVCIHDTQLNQEHVKKCKKVSQRKRLIYIFFSSTEDVSKLFSGVEYPRQTLIINHSLSNQPILLKSYGSRLTSFCMQSYPSLEMITERIRIL